MTSITITVANSSNATVAAVQNEVSLGSINAGCAMPVQIDPTIELYILEPVGVQWPLVCTVPANTLQNGAVVGDDIPWGGACPIFNPNPD